MRADLDPGKESGFALIDVLVGLAVVGLVGSLLTGVLSLAVRQQKNAARVQRIEEASLGISRLLQSLAEGAVLAHAGPVGRHSVQGSSGELVVISMGPPVLALGAPVRFFLRREKRRGGYDLLLSWEDPVSRHERTEVVLADAAEISFSYFNASDGHWTPGTGPQSDRIGAVRLAVRFGRDDLALDLIAPLHTKLPALCAANPTSVDCKDRLL